MMSITLARTKGWSDLRRQHAKATTIGIDRPFLCSPLVILSRRSLTDEALRSVAWATQMNGK